jgi:hypothetical protein
MFGHGMLGAGMFGPGMFGPAGESTPTAPLPPSETSGLAGKHLRVRIRRS